MQVLLCGTHYGSSYLPALWQQPHGLKLGGILSRGSERSRSLAARLSVPHYSALDQVPAGAIDAAVVAVGSGGAELARGLLDRGVHVLAEHPIEPGELAACLETAAERQRVFHLNSHFGDLETVSPFVHHAAELRQKVPLFFVSAHCNPRTAFSLIEILGRFLGALEPFTLVPPTALPEGEPAAFAALPAVFGGVPVTLLCQSVVSAYDDGSATLIGHQITAGFSSGSLVLGEAFGPVIWQTRLGPAQPPQMPWWSVLGPPAELAGNPHSTLRVRANVLALSRLAQQIQNGSVPPVQRPAHLLAVARVWRAAMDALGPARLGHYG